MIKKIKAFKNKRLGKQQESNANDEEETLPLPPPPAGDLPLPPPASSSKLDALRDETNE